MTISPTTDRFVRLRFTTLEDLRQLMGPGHGRQHAEQLWLLLTEARLVTRSPSGSVVGPVTPGEWAELCQRASASSGFASVSEMQ